MRKNEKKVNKEMPFFPIGTFSATLNVHPRTLRIYDKEGILSPKRSEKNRRYYSFEDLEKGKLIQFLTCNLALNLSGVKLILAFLKKNKIKADKQIEYVKNMADIAGITLQKQENNIEKTSKRGRPNKDE